MFLKRNDMLAVLGLYCANYARRLYLREISRLSKLPLKTTHVMLVRLEKSAVIKSSIQGKNKYFTLNMENAETKLYLLQAEIYKTLVFVERYPLFKPFLKELKNVSAPLIVFGSFAKFTADKNSDIDMLVISDDNPDMPFYMLPGRIHKISLSEKEFMRGVETNETLIKEIEENHVILNNHCFLVNKMWGSYAGQA